MEDWQLENLIKNCTLLSSLALRGYVIEDDLLFVLIKGACGIKTLDLSGSSGVSGTFLRYLAKGSGTDSLETLILRDCKDLRAKEVSGFLSAVLYGDWKALRFVDISNRWGLHFGLGIRCAIDVSEILQQRPDIHLIADYPLKLCFYGDSTSLPPPSSSSDASFSAYSSDEASSSCSIDANSFSDDEDMS